MDFFGGMGGGAFGPLVDVGAGGGMFFGAVGGPEGGFFGGAGGFGPVAGAFGPGGFGPGAGAFGPGGFGFGPVGGEGFGPIVGPGGIVVGPIDPLYAFQQQYPNLPPLSGDGSGGGGGSGPTVVKTGFYNNAGPTNEHTKFDKMSDGTVRFYYADNSGPGRPMNLENADMNHDGFIDVHSTIESTPNWGGAPNNGYIDNDGDGHSPASALSGTVFFESSSTDNNFGMPGSQTCEGCSSSQPFNRQSWSDKPNPFHH